jgi:threonine dehydrogenase-like Zn-dependent dehydrogenase
VRVLHIDDRRSLSLTTLPAPRIDGECLIEVGMAGICGTDLQLLKGYAGFTGVPGHEFVGTVREVTREEDTSWLGARVVGEINAGCGHCDFCEAGIKEHCRNRTVLGIVGRSGAFADFLSLPAANLHRVPDTITDSAAVFVEPLAAACRIVEQVPSVSGARVAVVGDGRLGLLCAQVLAAAGAHVTVLGRHAWKLAIAQTFGLSVRRADEAEDPAQFDVVVEATGRAEGFAKARALVRPRGTIVLKSTVHDSITLPLWPVVVDELTLVGSRCGPFDKALDLLERELVRVDPLVSAIVPLDAYEAAFEAAHRQLKLLFRINESS